MDVRVPFAGRAVCACTGTRASPEAVAKRRYLGYDLQRERRRPVSGMRTQSLSTLLLPPVHAASNWIGHETPARRYAEEEHKAECRNNRCDHHSLLETAATT